jgi:putative peptide zinc metalloprotease protein
MSATVDRPAAAAITEAPGPLERAQGLELLGDVSGSGYKDGAALVRRADGQMVQLGPLQYGLLEEADGERDHAALAAAMSERLGRRLEVEHVGRIGEKLAEQGLLAGAEENAPPRSNPLLALRWKVLFTDPKVTGRITAPFRPLFRPWVLIPAVAGFLAVCWFVLIHKGVAPATAQAFDNPELLLLVLGLAIASAAFHEIGHAAACRYGGGRPGGMGAGIYMVWPAFYTDVTDAYRLPRPARLRTDLGGIYFNAVIAVITLGAWLATGLDVLLLLIGLQMLEIVKNLSPVIRADGYHILSDATGVPDLYAHMGPTLRRLLPWKKQEPSALKGSARALVIAWVLVIVPILLAMAFSAILLFPKLAASSWESGSKLVSAIPDQAGDTDVLGLIASVVRLFALALPVAGVALFARRLIGSIASKAWGWSGGQRPRQALVLAGAAALIALLTWAWWPSGQYRPVRPTDDGTLVGAFRTVGAPASVARPSGVVAPPRLSPGRHLAVALIPRGGPTKEHPALFVVNGGDHRDKPTILVSPTAPDARKAATVDDPGAGQTGSGSTAAPARPTTKPPADAPSTPTAPATQLPFKLPHAPGQGDSQALATNTKDGGIVYDIAYSLVTVSGGEPADNENSAYALASCNACTTLAVSFQLVLVVGQSDRIMPINVAEALNLKCPSCITTAIAKQIVISVSSVPSDVLLQRLMAELKKLGAIDTNDSPSDVLAQVNAVTDAIQRQLDDSGITYPKATPKPRPAGTPDAAKTPDATATPEASAEPGSAASPAPTPTASPPPSGAPVPTSTPAATPTPTPTATPTPSATPAPTP